MKCFELGSLEKRFSVDEDATLWYLEKKTKMCQKMSKKSEVTNAETLD
jgi:hypothetical protein